MNNYLESALLISFLLGTIGLLIYSYSQNEGYFPSWLIPNPGWDRVGTAGYPWGRRVLYTPHNYRKSPTLTKEFFYSSGIPDGNKYQSLYPGSRWRGLCNPTTPQCPSNPKTNQRRHWFRNWFMTSSSPFIRPQY